jgi:hypothetical protein
VWGDMWIGVWELLYEASIPFKERHFGIGSLRSLLATPSAIQTVDGAREWVRQGVDKRGTGTGFSRRSTASVI